MRLALSAAPFLTRLDPPIHLNTSVNLGLYHLAAAAQEAGHEVSVVDPSRIPSRMDDTAFTTAFAGHYVIGLSSTTSIWHETLRLIERLRSLTPRPIIVAGGPHPTLFTERVLRTSGVDYVARGEGEITLVELLAALERGSDPAGLPGLACLRSGRLVVGPDRELLTEDELARLPAPLYDLMPLGYYKMLPVETSRGCLHRCTFCSITYPRTFRDMGPERLARCLAAAGPMLNGFTDGLIHIIDDCFLTRTRDLDALGRALRRFSLPLAASTRVSDLMAPRTLDFYAGLPVKVCEVGVECGYAEGIKKVGKGVTLTQVEELAAELKSRDIIAPVLFAYVIGFPWESVKECLATIRFAFDLARRYGGWIQLGWFMLYPGSEIYLHPERYGIEIKEEEYDHNIFIAGSGPFMRMRPRMSLQDVQDVRYALEFTRRQHPEVRIFSMI